MNSCFFKLYCNYSNTLTLSNLGELSLKLKLCSELPGQRNVETEEKRLACARFSSFSGEMSSLINYTLFRQLLIVYLAAFYVVCGYTGVVPDTEFGAKNKPSKIAKNFGWLKGMKCV